MDFLTWKLRTKSERLSVIWGSKWAHRCRQIFRPHFISYKAFSTCCIPPCNNFLLVSWHFIQFPDLDLKHCCLKYMPLELNPYLSLPKQFLSVFWNPAFLATSGNTTWPWVGLGWLSSMLLVLLPSWPTAGWVQLLEDFSVYQPGQAVGAQLSITHRYFDSNIPSALPPRCSVS